MMILRLTERVLGRTRLTLTEADRVILTRKGRVHAILGAGEHRVRTDDSTQWFSLTPTALVSNVLDPLMRERPDLVAAHLTEVRTGADEVALIAREGRLAGLLGPEARAVYWTDAGPWQVETRAVSHGAVMPHALGARLVRANLDKYVQLVEVPDGHVALHMMGAKAPEIMQAGTHHLWDFGPRMDVRLVDMRSRLLEVNGHEILTRDRVTVRVNLVAEYRVTDPVLARQAVKDFEAAMRTAMGLAFRRTLGALTLDALLADKVAVDAEAADAVRADMARIGVAVGDIALKDVILPGEMRDILTAVVAAEKEAEANVIRRREETNATRSLLNTAKVMADNPVLLRLKELEALEAIAGKVERLTVTNGTAGLMHDLVSLRDT